MLPASLALLAESGIPVQPISFPAFSQADIDVSMLRLDLVHHTISGNKWFKLHDNLLAAVENKARTLVSFGGVWSNHLHALAWAGQLLAIPTIAFVRGEVPDPMNACLSDCHDWGMQIIPLSREDYRRRDDEEFVSLLVADMERPYVIPEGGANRAGVRGCAKIWAHIDQQAFDQLALACGTGTTMAGMLSDAGIPVLGVQVLKGEGYLSREVRQLMGTLGIESRAPWRIEDRYHRGGYAKADAALFEFCDRFEQMTAIPLEPVYSGKLMMALCELAEQGAFPAGHRLCVIHGGGLQGRRGFTAT